MNGDEQADRPESHNLLDSDTIPVFVRGELEDHPIVTHLSMAPEEPEPEEVDALDEASKGNFLPVLLMLQRGQSINLRSIDQGGYGIVHYAVCFANFQVEIA